MKTLYQNIRTQLEAHTSAAHVRLWNNQMQLSEEGQQIPFQFPACFIDFPTIEWKQLPKDVQQSEGLLVRIYIAFESFATFENEEDLAVFDLRQEVYLALQQFKPTKGSKLLRIAEQTDTRHSNVYLWVMDFVTNFQDSVGQYPRGGVTAQINTLTLTNDVQIDAGSVDGIRTDNSFL